jgi:hypothetical protein
VLDLAEGHRAKCWLYGEKDRVDQPALAASPGGEAKA